MKVYCFLCPRGQRNDDLDAITTLGVSTLSPTTFIAGSAGRTQVPVLLQRRAHASESAAEYLCINAVAGIEQLSRRHWPSFLTASSGLFIESHDSPVLAHPWMISGTELAEERTCFQAS
eukprot:1284254-Amphidinium_carterae.1